MDLFRSNPYSSRYGHHLSIDEVRDLFAPTEKSARAVRSWLESASISKDRITQSANKQWIHFDADAEALEDLLHTKYHVYSHAETGRSHVACREYHLPSSVREHVDYITPGISLWEVTAVRISIDKQKRFADGIPPITEPIPLPIETLSSEAASFCDQAIMPECILQMYNISEGHTATEGNELGIFEDIGDVYAQEDLNLFFSKLYPKIPNGTHPTLKSVDGGEAPTNTSTAGPESDLDFQISYPIIWPQNSILFQTDDIFGENNGIYNRIGRAYPDVAAVGDKVVIYNRGMAVAIGGTSASAPVFAGILTRINEERLAAGKSTVGFVNPVLYAHPEAFFDVTKGTNAGCNTIGFFAVKGWDPVTGLGTPNYPELLKGFMGY
ncbi:Peptidase S8/S53 subtilisin/kexin/sedolisin [Penicillium cf. griseofulvum]|nr:Peptidase S8/S53 subtilisin/kexin/sedolisin [Penicillium cf. griseofulvum]